MRSIIVLLTVIALSLCNPGGGGVARAASPPATPENVSVLVIIIDFLDAPRPTDIRYKDGVDQFVPLTVANAEDVFFDNSTSMAERYLEMSNGLLTVTGDVIEASLPLNIGTSALDDWRLAADAEAAVQGYPVANYDRVGYVLAHGFKDQFRTGGAIGTYFWATGINAGNAYVLEFVFNHEFGHTVDLEHAQSINGFGAITVEGDKTDFMGLGDAVHTNAVNKWAKGWLDGVRNADHPVDTTATYDISPLARTASAELQTVVIDSHGSSPAVGEDVDTWLSYRRPINFDSNLSLIAMDAYGTLLRHTVHVHHRRKSGGEESFFDRALQQGDSYDACGTLISVVSINPQRAQVDIDQSPYNPTAPAIQVLPQGATSVVAGTTVLYDLSVTNSDPGTGACEAFYEQEIVAPGPGWTAGWAGAGQSIAVETGQVEVFSNFTVHAPIGTPPGVYNVSFKLTNNGGSGAPVDATVMIPYEVLVPLDTTPPTAPTNLVPTETPGSHVILSWTASTDDVGVYAYHVYHNSTLLPIAGSNTLYVDFPPPSGGYTFGGTNGYVVYAVDAAGNVSPPSNWAFVGDDLIAPSTPTGLIAFSDPSMVALDWDDSTDNVGVTDYDVHRDGFWIATTTASDWTDWSVSPGNIYSYTVTAWDGFGNLSAPSAPVEISTGPETIEQVPSLSWPGTLLLIATLIGSSSAVARRRARGR